MDINGKILIVTGAGGGLGRIFSTFLYEQGATVIAVDISSDSLHFFHQYPRIITKCFDSTSEDDAARHIAEIEKEYGHIDGLINNAGIIHNEPIASFSLQGVQPHSLQSWHNVLQGCLTTTFVMGAQVIASYIRTRSKGVIVNISSVCAAGNPGQSAYAAAKAGVNALTATWAKELGPSGIRVVGIAPGYIDAGSTYSTLSDEQREYITKEIPLRTLGAPADICNALLLALTNGYIHGKTLEVDGGLNV